MNIKPKEHMFEIGDLVQWSVNFDFWMTPHMHVLPQFRGFSSSNSSKEDTPFNDMGIIIGTKEQTGMEHTVKVYWFRSGTYTDTFTAHLIKSVVEVEGGCECGSMLCLSCARGENANID
jgi:hypothetical protein